LGPSQAVVEVDAVGGDAKAFYAAAETALGTGGPYGAVRVAGG
jgi:hypothetical protein